MTPRQVQRALNGRDHGIVRQRNERATLAWMIANLSRAKAIPALRKLLDEPGGRRRVRQSEAQMLNVARMMAGVSFPEVRKG